MRIQILPLPPISHGDATDTPFVVVIDRIPWDETLDPVMLGEWIKEKWGARSVLLGHEDVEISPALELPDELREQLLAHLDSTIPKETP